MSFLIGSIMYAAGLPGWCAFLLQAAKTISHTRG